MTSTPKVITAAAIEPITVSEAKFHCRVDNSVEDDLFEGFISAAKDYVEDQSGWTIHQTTYEVALDCWPRRSDRIVLPRATPLISVTSVTWYDEDGAATVLTPTTDYLLDTYGLPGGIYLPNDTTWPTGTLRRVNGIIIRYVAGIATTSPVTEAPGSMKLPALKLVAGMYEMRESETFTDRASIESVAMRYGVEAFISRLRQKLDGGASSY
jgi:uncharacterized phiE125 gp8 family phage protein